MKYPYFLPDRFMMCRAKVFLPLQGLLLILQGFLTL
jgi:hypothetical protein